MISFTDPNLQPLEIWHGRMKDKFIYEFQGLELTHALGNFLDEIFIGKAKTRDQADTNDLQFAQGFTRVLIGGGNSSVAAALVNKRNLPYKVEFIADEGQFSGWSGAQSIFNLQKWQRGVAMDVGQSAIKIMHALDKVRHQRNLDLLPIKSDSVELSVQRDRLKFWIRNIIREEEEKFQIQFDGLCLALPVKIRGLLAETCTYAGLGGDLKEFFADLHLPPTVVMNDAVLAALGNRIPGEKTLVITIGLGLGAALWHK
jgi:hypothetical protein